MASTHQKCTSTFGQVSFVDVRKRIWTIRNKNSKIRYPPIAYRLVRRSCRIFSCCSSHLLNCTCSFSSRNFTDHSLQGHYFWFTLGLHLASIFVTSSTVEHFVGLVRLFRSACNRFHSRRVCFSLIHHIPSNPTNTSIISTRDSLFRSRKWYSFLTKLMYIV